MSGASHVDVAFNVWLGDTWVAGADAGGMDYEESATFTVTSANILYIHVWEGWRYNGAGFYELEVELLS